MISHGVKLNVVDWIPAMPEKERAKYLQHCKRMKDGEYFQPFPRMIRSQRSLDQNAYYWAILTQLAEFCGYDDPDEVHIALRFKFLKTEKGPLDTARSTTVLDTKEFAEYIEKIRRWALDDFGFYVMTPEEYKEHAA